MEKSFINSGSFLSILNAYFTYFYSMEVTCFIFHVLFVLTLMETANSRATKQCKEPKDLGRSCVDASSAHESFNMIELNSITNDVKAFIDIRRTSLARDAYSEQCAWQTGNGNSYNSSCPHHYVMNEDPNRRPKVLLEAKCNCDESQPCLNGQPGTRCMPVKYYINVLRKNGCDGSSFTYTQTVEPITVGCTCAYPISAGSETGSVHYVSRD